MTSLRILIIGGLTSYRALFNWLTPWILIPSFLLGPIFQILFFAYIGRAAGVGDDTFFLVGNAVLYASIPCLFAMDATIAGERQQGTLALLLASPARRLPLFLGRALPVVVNGFGVAAVALAVGALLLGVRLPVDVWFPLMVTVAVCAFSCTGLGLLSAALALRVRDTAVLSNVIFGLLLIFAGVNVPLATLPAWMSEVAQWLPLSHGIDAARRVATGAGLGDIAQSLAIEAAIGLVYSAFGMGLLAWFERESRRKATLETY